jgi:hypothetical protein
MKTMLRATLVALVLVLTTAGTAFAAPAATTGGASNVTANSVRLAGSVDPNGQPTTYYFEYGTTQRYGSRTPDVSVGSGGSPQAVRADLSGLAANTTYHYRIVASNPSGVASGGDRTFRTDRQPLGLSITANPNPVVFGSPTTIAGTLTGTGNAGREVVLQARGFPYTSEFAQVGNPLVTDANGNFAFPLLSVPANTQYRVVSTEGRDVPSPILTLNVAVSVKTNVSATRVTRGRSIRFSGTIRPARAGAQWAIQKKTRSGAWATITGSITRGGSQSFSGFSRKVRIPRGGTYRVFVLIVDGNLTSGIGREIKISTRR